ncbi:MAG: enoyl-CoA hydratase/isomerase family protein, partial [Deltaproteobacteria bacterium]|nr:enoyl-CoA hydratase/isomerase family protein [Deltaproteobacteria bacterium]
MNYDCLKIQEKYDGQVTEILMGPPPANIVSLKLMEEVLDCLKELKENPNKKLITFSGEGKRFSFGASVEEHLPGVVNDMIPKFHHFIGEILACEIPTLAKVSGLCLGGGFEMALACTFLFANENAKFAIPEIQLGVFPPVASVLLPFKGGDVFSSEMILTGETFGAHKLLERGILNTVEEEGALDTSISTFIEKMILPKSASSLRLACRAARMTLLSTYKQ